MQMLQKYLSVTIQLEALHSSKLLMRIYVEGFLIKYSVDI